MRNLSALPPMYKWGGATLIGVVILLGWQIVSRSSDKAGTELAYMRHVEVASVAQLSSDLEPLPVTGKITSRSQASVLSQSAGQIVSLQRSIGDRVGAGEVIAVFENASQRAARTQAQGAYEAAQAALEKAEGTTAANSSLTSTQAAQSAASYFASLSTYMQSTYAALDSAVRASADTMFSNPRTSLAAFAPSVPDNQLVVTITNQRQEMETVLSTAQMLSQGLSYENADDRVDSMRKASQATLDFLNNVITATSKAQPNSTVSAAAIATYQTTMTTSRTTVVTAVSALTAAKVAFDGARTSAQTAANSADTATGTDVAAAKAALKQAQGGLDAANANYEKTIVRSPISGTIVSLPLHEGDYVPMYSQVAQISNPLALEVQAFVTPEDARSLAVGNKALIDDRVEGTISFIAPAIDPTTGKIEVKVSISSGQDRLSNGDTESVLLYRKATQAPVPALTTEITIPIVAVKITPSGPAVFSVSTTSKLITHAVVLGTILGDRVVVAEGLTPEMLIITDARGLSDGEMVALDE